MPEKRKKNRTGKRERERKKKKVNTVTQLNIPISEINFSSPGRPAIIP